MLHSNRRMYGPFNGESKDINPREVHVAEEHIMGREYSCDFIIDGDRINIIRIARKLLASDKPFGTALAYLLPAHLPGGLDIEELKVQLLRASQIMDLNRAMAMVDFIVHNDRAYLLELTPRPGGDCLPELILASSGFDILRAALDFAEGRPINVPPPDTWKSLVGLRLFAPSDGIVKIINAEDIIKDQRVISCNLKRSPGHKVILPPDDYDSWLLGTVIFQPSDPHRVENECLDLYGKLKLELKAPAWAAA
jgi:predicted ATP-grasp superfamily ATP-dependent carboligase